MYGYFCERDYEGDFPYTDLACERRRANVSIDGVDYKKEVGIGGVWERIRISSAEGEKSIGRPRGIYDTLKVQRMDLIDEESIEDAQDEVARELCYLCDREEIIPERILVVGLGNGALTPDSVGTKSAARVKATMQIREFDEKFFDSLECSEIAVCTPGVASDTGIDSAIAVSGICGAIKPDAVIVVDALASRAVERLGSTIQFSNTGILPGSGLGNARRAINKESVGAPVISIGVPTVIDSRMFWMDSVGERDERVNPGLARRAMFVSPREINDIVDVAARIVGGGINQAFGLYF